MSGWWIAGCRCFLIADKDVVVRCSLIMTIGVSLGVVVVLLLVVRGNYTNCGSISPLNVTVTAGIKKVCRLLIAKP